MVRANQPILLIKSLGSMIKQREGIQSTKPNLASVSEEPPDPPSFCKDIDPSEFVDPELYHNIFTKLIATSDIVSPDLSVQLTLQSIRGFQYALFFIWNNYIHYEMMVTRSAKLINLLPISSALKTVFSISFVR